MPDSLLAVRSTQHSNLDVRSCRILEVHVSNLLPIFSLIHQQYITDIDRYIANNAHFLATTHSSFHALNPINIIADVLMLHRYIDDIVRYFSIFPSFDYRYPILCRDGPTLEISTIYLRNIDNISPQYRRYIATFQTLLITHF